MTSAQVVETSVNVISNSPSQDYTHPDDRTLLNDLIHICKYCKIKVITTYGERDMCIKVESERQTNGFQVTDL